MSFLADLDASDAGLGGKARSLARLAALGFPTPPGFVVRDSLFRAICPPVSRLDRFDESALRALDRIRDGIDRTPWPSGFLEELELRLRTLGAKRFSVRSSFASEDRAGALAAGVYESCVDVPLGEVKNAIRRVLRSAMSAGAAAYAMAHGQNPGDAPVAVLVHAFVSGPSEGSAAFVLASPPSAGRVGRVGPPSAGRVGRVGPSEGSAAGPAARARAGQGSAAGPAARARAGPSEGSVVVTPSSPPEAVLVVRRGSLSEAARAELQSSLTRLAQALGAVEIEWVLSGQHFVYLQVRPFQPKAPPVEWSGWKDLPPTAGERDAWNWDVAHNPLPLSPAQAGLVEFVDQRCQIGIRQRVLGSYLFYARDAHPVPCVIEAPAAASYFEEMRCDFEARQAALGPTPALEDALSLFADIYQRIFGVLQPALKQARRALQDFLREHAPARLALLPALVSGVPSLARVRRCRAHAIDQASTDDERARAREAYLALFGDETPVWDVCTPTYAEDSSSLLTGRTAYKADAPAAAAAAAAEPRVLVDWQTASEAVQAQFDDLQLEAWRDLLAVAREAVSLSEADDWLYARAQAVVRRGLFAVGQVLAQAGSLSVASEVFFLPLQLVRGIGLDPPRAGSLADLAAAGRSAWQAAQTNPPPAPVWHDDNLVRGHGVGGHAVGRVIAHRPGSFRQIPTDGVLLAMTLLPTELPLVSAAAIVTETGGPLDHVAAQARERGIPGVIGAAGAGSLLHEGDLVLVDGERGLVVNLQRS